MVTLQDFLTDLTDLEKPVKFSGLLQFSDLPVEGVAEFKMNWLRLPVDRKHEIALKLVELADENIELDFSSVFKACLQDDDEIVREMAVKGLWETEDRALIRPLVKLLEDDSSLKVRASAGISLRNFAVMAQNGKLLSRDGDRIRDAFMKVISQPDEDIEVRRRAIEAIANFNTPETNDVIRDAYESNDLALIQSAIYAMGQSSNPEWLTTVLDEMAHPSPAIRYEAATAGGLLGDEAVVSHLIRLLQDDDPEVSLASIKSLGQIGGLLAKRALQLCLSDGDESIEEAAQTALANLEFNDDPLGFRFEP
jgi:HEAT repeat protein